MKKFRFILLTFVICAFCSSSAMAGDDFLERGFRGMIDLGGQYGFGDAKDNYFIQSSFTGGYQINHMLFVGSGVAPSLSLFDNKWRDEVELGFVMPIYASIRCDFVNSTISPFLETRGGYFITDDSDSHGGYVYAGTGCRFNKFSLSAGYSLYIQDGWTGHFAGLKFGFEF